MKPHKEASIRGYIIKSRIRRTENLIIAGPYNPCLFRMGAPAGPRYLLQTLQGKLTRKEALRQWKKEEAEQKAAAEEEKSQQAKWPFYMRLPCRHCEKMLKLTAFAGPFTNYEEI